jgi:hypothetical protein
MEHPLADFHGELRLHQRKKPGLLRGAGLLSTT